MSFSAVLVSTLSTSDSEITASGWYASKQSVNNCVFIVNYWQTVNFKVKGHIGRITDGYGNSRFRSTIADVYGNSGFRFTNQNKLTRGVTTRNFADVRAGVKIIVPGVHRTYEK